MTVGAEQKQHSVSAIPVPLLDLKAQYATIRDDVRLAIERVIEAQAFVLGPEVTSLEKELAEFLGIRHCVGVSSGTDALLVALMALNVGPGDEVVTTPYSFFATAGVIARLNARPVFVDIEPDTFNLNENAACAALTERTRAAMPVHLFGRVAELAALKTAAGARGIPIVEDAAQALGAVNPAGQQAGSIGAVGCFSFYPSKNLGAFGDAGLVSCNDDGLAERLRILRVHGGHARYYHDVVGGNFRIDAIQAAVLRVKLPHLPAWTAGRRRNADRYRQLFAAAGLDEIVRLPADAPGHIYNQFVVRVPDRDQVQLHLKGHGIGTDVYYPLPLHLQECFHHLGYKAGDFPESERAAAESLALPIYPELTEGQQEWVVECIRRFYDRSRAS
ncbi:MAG: DegT/DnrJ/EryC1/StrS family aminotransferase [Gemmatimonadota bacterium]